MKAKRNIYIFIFVLWYGVLLLWLLAIGPLREPMGRAFIADAGRGSVVKMQLWLWAGVNVHYFTNDEEIPGYPDTALSAAAWRGRMDAVSFLISRGACVSDCERELSLAVQAGNSEVADLLRSHLPVTTRCREATLFEAAENGDTQTVERLLALGACEGNGVKEKALRRAIIHDRPETVRALLARGARVNDLLEIEIEKGVPTILQVAQNHNNPDIISMVKGAGAK